MFVLYSTKVPYRMMVERGVEDIRAVYYNRKIVHMFAGGVGSLCVPFLFTDFWYPMVCGIILRYSLTSPMFLEGGCTGFRRNRIRMM